MLGKEDSAPSPFHNFKKAEYLSIKDLQAKCQHI
jgi:hypothetical protein